MTMRRTIQNKLTVISQFEELGHVKAPLLLEDGEGFAVPGGDDRLEVARPVVPFFHVH